MKLATEKNELKLIGFPYVLGYSLGVNIGYEYNVSVS